SWSPRDGRVPPVARSAPRGRSACADRADLLYRLSTAEHGGGERRRGNARPPRAAGGPRERARPLGAPARPAPRQGLYTGADRRNPRARPRGVGPHGAPHGGQAPRRTGAAPPALSAYRGAGPRRSHAVGSRRDPGEDRGDAG